MPSGLWHGTIIRDHALQLIEDSGILGGGHLVGEKRQDLARPDLARMHGQGGHHEYPAGGHELLALLNRELRFEGQTAIDLPELVEPFDVRRRRQEQHIHGSTEGGRADLSQLRPVRGRCKGFEVIDELLVVRQLAIGPRNESEQRLRRRNRGQTLARQTKQYHHNCDNDLDPESFHEILPGSSLHP